MRDKDGRFVQANQYKKVLAFDLGLTLQGWTNLKGEVDFSTIIMPMKYTFENQWR